MTIGDTKTDEAKPGASVDATANGALLVAKACPPTTIPSADANASGTVLTVIIA
jgi:hypothetical protein